MDKLHYYVCQMDKLLAKYVKIAGVDSGHIIELDKTMENMRFVKNMNDQYMNKSDNKEDGKDDVEDIDPGDKLVNYFNNGKNTTMMMTMMMKKMMIITIGTAVMMTMRTVTPLKEGDSLLQAVYLEVIIADKCFNFRIVSMYKIIYRS
jgi:hypothetical protein